MLFVWFGELLLPHVPVLVPASSTQSVRLRSRGYQSVSSFGLDWRSVNSITVGPCVYLGCEIVELVRSPDLLQYHQRMSPPGAADEGTANSQRPQCRLRRQGSQYMSQAYSCQQWWIVQVWLRVRTTSRILRGEDSSVGIRNAEAASVIGWFMEGMLIWLVLRADLRRPSFIPESSG
jgi:hypothetical protein